MTSEARILANRANSLKSTGPTSPEGRERSRRNGLKHGLTGQGIVVPEQDADEIQTRAEALHAEMAPKSTMGAILVRQLASLSVRMERGARREEAAIASRVRHAADDFDVERIEDAEWLLEDLAEDPRGNLRKLRRSPEGVNCLIAAWQDLRDDLAKEPWPRWDASHMKRAASLAGLKAEDIRESRIGALSRAIRADFQGLEAHEGAGLDEKARQAWARGRLLERVDGEIAGLEAHYQTLDLVAIELDRLEAGDRALFDPSKEASLARRYESEARRGFFKALKEFRQVEAEAAERAEEAPASPPSSICVRSYDPLASSREGSAPEPRTMPTTAARPSSPDFPTPFEPALGPEIQVPTTGWAAQGAG